MGTARQTKQTDKSDRENHDEQMSPCSDAVVHFEGLMLVTNDQWALAATPLVWDRVVEKGQAALLLLIKLNKVKQSLR
jgi:hypothetical protein